MTDDVKIDYAELADEAMQLTNDLMKIAHRFKKFGKTIDKVGANPFDKNFQYLSQSVEDHVEKMAALYFELKDKE